MKTMKTAKMLVLGLVAVAALGLGSEELFNVPFVLGPTHFKDGDQIVIQDVLATSTNLTVGDKVVVRGRYDLKSQQKATLSLYLTSNAGAGEPNVPTQSTEIAGGSGEFELSRVVRHPGYLHLSLYRTSGGTDFGCVYFGTETQMSKIRHWNISGD
jgi:hypothetical protein